jgi:putative phage-type endonuclease
MALTKTELAERAPKIGGDDAAAICGKHPYKTAYEVALRIRGELQDANLEGIDLIEFGNEMEDVLARFYERKNNVKLIKPPRIEHPKFPFLSGNIDRRIVGDDTTIIECKNTGLYAAEWWGQPGTDEVPERVVIQVSHYMGLESVIQRAKVLRCFGGNVYQEFIVPRNDELIESLQEIEVDFMAQVQAGQLPDPDYGHRSTKETLKRAFKKIQGTVEARGDLVSWTDNYEQIAAELARYRDLEEAMKNQIVHLLGNTEVAILPDGRRWRRKLVQKKPYSVGPTEYIEAKLLKAKND